MVFDILNLRVFMLAAVAETNGMACSDEATHRNRPEIERATEERHPHDREGIPHQREPTLW
jgi:hypothetical protein